MKKIMVLAACLALLTAGAAQAASINLGSVNSMTNDIPMLVDSSASLVDGGGPFSPVYLTDNGNTSLLQYVYCLDMDTNITGASYYGTTFNQSGVIYGSPLSNANQVGFLLSTFAPTTTAGTDKARALQGYIWSLTDTSLANSGQTWAVNPGYTGVYNWFQTMQTAMTNDYDPSTNYIDDFYWITAGRDTNNDGINDVYQPQALVALSLSPPVPIPGTVLLMGSGLAGLVGIARFRRKRSAN